MKNILIVDDNEADHIIAEYIIADYAPSITIYKAYDGREALNIINSLDDILDLICLDINMPGMDGHEFLEKYAQLNKIPAVVVMLTSSEQLSDKDKCQQYPFVKAYITKPLEIDDLVNIIS